MIVKKLAVKIGTYQKDGITKNKYENIGALITKDNGDQYILLSTIFNPAGVPRDPNTNSIIVSIFDEKGVTKQDVNTEQPKSNISPVNPNTADGVPF